MIPGLGLLRIQTDTVIDDDDDDDDDDYNPIQNKQN